MIAKAYLVQHATGPRIEVHFEGLAEPTLQARRVTNSRRLREGVYKYPLSVDKCWEMREAWGKQLKVHRELSVWYKGAAAERAAQVLRTTQSDVKLDVLPQANPKLNAWLHGDQRVTAAWMANAYRGGGLLADEVGTGKTAGIIAGIIEAQRTGPILVVCPKLSVNAVWGKHFRELWPQVPVYLARGVRGKREKVLDAFDADPAPTKVLVIVAEMLRIKALRAKGRITEFLGYEYPDLFAREWGTVIVDESHRLLGSLDVVKGTLAGEGLRDLPTTPDRLKMVVSATPFGKGGRIDALFGSLHWLWPDEFTSRWAWLGRFFHISEGEVFVRGGRGAKQTVRKIGGIKDDIGEQGLWDSLGPRVLRRTMEEVSPEHRGLKSWIQMDCEMNTAQAKLYARFAEHGEVAVPGGLISSTGVLDFLTRSRQLANGMLRVEGGRVRYTGVSAKIDRLIEHLDNRGVLDRTNPLKVVVSSQYNEFLDAVETRLDVEKCAYHRLDGKTTEARRERMMNEFQTPGGPQVFLLNSQAGGVSITLDAADELHQLDKMYPPEANTQLYGRIFRRGRVHKVFFYNYVSMGTIDEQINDNTEEGAAKQARLLDGRRGLEYAKEIATYRAPKGV